MVVESPRRGRLEDMDDHSPTLPAISPNTTRSPAALRWGPAIGGSGAVWWRGTIHLPVRAGERPFVAPNP